MDDHAPASSNGNPPTASNPHDDEAGTADVGAAEHQASGGLEWPGAGPPPGPKPRDAAPDARREGSTPSPLRSQVAPAETEQSVSETVTEREHVGVPNGVGVVEWPGAGAPTGISSRDAAPDARREGSTPSPLRPDLSSASVGVGPLTLGTAGHIDHGKTTLINALTGVNTDRLPEEQSRGISITLGYAPMSLPSGRQVSVIDVPGHERFVRTMVSGATGIDIFLMIIAADDGVMPQTIEHARILDILGVTRGVVAVSKSDLIDPEPAMQEAAKLLPGVEMVGCSAITGDGLDDLNAAIERVAESVPSRAGSEGGVVLHIDRAFTITGRGTVVTGTLWSGRVNEGDTLTLMPQGRTVRVRGVQVHNHQQPYADAGQRVAVNLTGVHFDEVNRGDALIQPGLLTPTSILDCRLTLTAATHNMPVAVHHGTRAVPGRLAALGDDLWQVRLEQPLLAADEDRLVIRRPAPPDTLGGGVILNAHAHKHGPKDETTQQLRETRQPDAAEQAPELLPVSEQLRKLPAVDQLAAELLAENHDGGGPTETEAMAAARAVLDRRREELRDCNAPHVDLLARCHTWLEPSMQRVLNGTGVVLHTNLGRAPLANSAAEAVNALARGYTNLELDLSTGERGHRDQHLTSLICELTEAEDAFAVNNGASAVLLAVTALTGPGKSILISRGQLVEIGGGFRMPDVITQSGAQLIEVGTTNRTHLADYQHGIQQGADIILAVHSSNFQTLGYTSEVPIETLCTLGLPVIHDLGSGVLAENLHLLAEEPAVRRSIKAGATVVCFSGDKLLGGPQAGILAGTHQAIDACRKHPLTRALRIGRLPLAALEATLRLYRDPARAVSEIPVLSMLAIDPIRLQHRAKTLAQKTDGELIEATARVGGGALPLLDLTGPAVALPYHGNPTRLAQALRQANPPLLTRVNNDRVLVDPRTLPDNALNTAANVIRHTISSLIGQPKRMRRDAQEPAGATLP
jgi:L-seryl-tRNA(Sec) selenium transferase